MWTPRSEIREFLTSRRARITPDQVGLATYGPRRVPGLRREEVAVFAGVSVPYYTRLERGDMNGVSEACWKRSPGRSSSTTPNAPTSSTSPAPHNRRRRGSPRQAKQRIRPDVQWTLDAITGAAAFVGNERLDILAANQLGRALFSELYAAPATAVNNARSSSSTREPRRSTATGTAPPPRLVAILRWAAGRDPHDRDLSDLVGELATHSETFRTRWAAHNVRFHDTGIKHFHHPIVGELSLTFNRLDLAADHGLTIFTYAAEPGSRAAEALKLLGSWAATVDPAESARSAPT